MKEAQCRGIKKIEKIKKSSLRGAVFSTLVSSMCEGCWQDKGLGGIESESVLQPVGPW